MASSKESHKRTYRPRPVEVRERPVMSGPYLEAIPSAGRHRDQETCSSDDMGMRLILEGCRHGLDIVYSYSLGVRGNVASGTRLFNSSI